MNKALLSIFLLLAVASSAVSGFAVSGTVGGEDTRTTSNGDKALL